MPTYLQQDQIQQQAIPTLLKAKMPDDEQKSEGPPETKRQRSSSTDPRQNEDPWADAKNLVSNTGTGFIGNGLNFSSSLRQVTVTQDIKAGTLLMAIDSESCITVTDLDGTKEGRQLIRATEKVEEDLCHFDSNDLLLAFYLATSPKKDIVRAYLATLPPSESYNALPRRWSEEKLSALLGGTSLLQRAKEDQLNLKKDYDTIVESLRKEDVSSAVPSFEQFDDMFAAVCSRGFAGLGSDDGKLDAMIPLLDLFDHRRGSDGKKDVRYKRWDTTDDDGTGSIFMKTSSIYVEADRDLKAGSVLHDTYGAKGNSQLLSRYGFCIENNFEPDGSSNDVLEFVTKESHPVVELRAGPKSYTYGGFVKALAAFSGTNKEGDDNAADEGGPDDMEAFLDMCDEEQEEGCGEFSDIIYGGGKLDNGDGEEEQEDEEESIQAECDALEKLSSALESKRQSYSLKGTALQDGLEKKDFSPEHNAAILIASERRTCLLFKLAADKIRSRLQGKTESGVKKSENTGGHSETLLSQVDELVSAYATIRHGGLI